MIQLIIAPYTAAEINARGFYFSDGFFYVMGSNAASQDGWHCDTLPDFTAQVPVMRSPGSTQFLDGEVGVSAVEQYGVNMFGNRNCFLDGTIIQHVNDLYQLNAWKR